MIESFLNDGTKLLLLRVFSLKAFWLVIAIRSTVRLRLALSVAKVQARHNRYTNPEPLQQNAFLWSALLKIMHGALSNQ